MAQADVDIAPNNTQTGNNPIAVNSGSWNSKTCYTEKINLCDPTTFLDASVTSAFSPGPNALNIQGVGTGGAVIVTGPGINSNGSGQAVPVTDTNVSFSAAAGAVTTIISGVAGKRTLITAIDWMAGGSGNIQFVYGASNTAVSGTYPVTAQTGMDKGTGYGCFWIIPAGQDFKISTSASASVGGSVSYTQIT